MSSLLLRLSLSLYEILACTLHSAFSRDLRDYEMEIHILIMAEQVRQRPHRHGEQTTHARELRGYEGDLESGEEVAVS